MKHLILVLFALVTTAVHAEIFDPENYFSAFQNYVRERSYDENFTLGAEVEVVKSGCKVVPIQNIYVIYCDPSRESKKIVRITEKNDDAIIMDEIENDKTSRTSLLRTSFDKSHANWFNFDYLYFIDLYEISFIDLKYIEYEGQRAVKIWFVWQDKYHSQKPVTYTETYLEDAPFLASRVERTVLDMQGKEYLWERRKILK